MGIQGMMHLLAPYCILSSYVDEEDYCGVSGPRNGNTSQFLVSVVRFERLKGGIGILQLCRRKGFTMWQCFGVCLLKESV